MKEPRVRQSERRTTYFSGRKGRTHNQRDTHFILVTGKCDGGDTGISGTE